MQILFIGFVALMTFFRLSFAALATPLPASQPTPSLSPLPGVSVIPSPSASKSPLSSPSPEPLATASASPKASQAHPSPPRPHPSGEAHQPILRAKALELAGAFTNDGYKIRDSFWLFMLPPKGQISLLAVNLFAGNQYWFCVAIAPPAQRVILKLYNEAGDLVSTQAYEKDATAALGAEPTESGKYYFSVELAEGAPGNFCVLYTYK